MKVSYKKIKCNKDWSRSVVDSYYDLRATDFLDNDELNQIHIYAVLSRHRSVDSFLPVSKNFNEEVSC